MDVFAIVWLVAIIVLALVEAGTTQLVAIWSKRSAPMPTGT